MYKFENQQFMEVCSICNGVLPLFSLVMYPMLGKAATVNSTVGAEQAAISSGRINVTGTCRRDGCTG